MIPHKLPAPAGVSCILFQPADGWSSIGWDSPWWDEIYQNPAVNDASLDSIPVGVTDLRTAAETSFTALTVLSLGYANHSDLLVRLCFGVC